MAGVSEFAFTYSSHAATQHAWRVGHRADHGHFATESLLNLARGNRSGNRDNQLLFGYIRPNLLYHFLHHLRLHANKDDVRPTHRSGIIRAHRHIKFLRQRPCALLVLDGCDRRLRR